jgi:hypothetical protein
VHMCASGPQCSSPYNLTLAPRLLHHGSWGGGDGVDGGTCTWRRASCITHSYCYFVLCSVAPRAGTVMFHRPKLCSTPEHGPLRIGTRVNAGPLLALSLNPGRGTWCFRADTSATNPRPRWRNSSRCPARTPLSPAGRPLLLLLQNAKVFHLPELYAALY